MLYEILMSENKLSIEYLDSKKEELFTLKRKVFSSNTKSNKENSELEK